MARHNHHGDFTLRRFPRATREEVPQQFIDYAKRRTAFLGAVALEQPLDYLLACAYLQGINDCVQAHVNRPDILPPVDLRGIDDGIT